MKKIVVWALLVALLAVLLAACGATEETTNHNVNLGDGGAPEYASQGLEFTYNSDTQSYYVSGLGTCTDRTIVIPTVHNGKLVTGIAAGAFKADKTEAAVGGSLVVPLGSEFGGSEFGGSFGGSAEGGVIEGGAEGSGSTVNDGKFEAVVIPDSIQEIGSEAFMGCESLEDVTLSSLVNMIGTDAFKDTAFYNDPENWDNGILYLEHYLVEALDDFAGALVIRAGITHIADGAFENCAGLTAVTFPDGIASIGQSAFRGCTSIEAIDLSFSGVLIGRMAFYGCTALKSVKIGDDSLPSPLPEEDREKLNKMSSSYFDDDEKTFSGLTVSFTTNYFTYGGEGFVYATVIEDSAFAGCSALTDIKVGKNLKYIGAFAFSECTSLVTVSLDAMTVATDGANDPALQRGTLKRFANRMDSVFYGCTSLESATLPEGVTVLFQLFKECTSLKSVSLPSSVKTLNRAFEGCTSLASVTLPEGLSKLSYSAFAGCRALASVAIPDSVTVIREGALSGLADGATVTVGKGVATVGEGALSGNVSITYRGSKAEWQAISLHENFIVEHEGSVTVVCNDGEIVK